MRGRDPLHRPWNNRTDVYFRFRSRRFRRIAKKMAKRWEKESSTIVLRCSREIIRLYSGTDERFARGNSANTIDLYPRRVVCSCASGGIKLNEKENDAVGIWSFTTTESCSFHGRDALVAFRDDVGRLIRETNLIVMDDQIGREHIPTLYAIVGTFVETRVPPCFSSSLSL